jgi:hypothetical protein
VETLNKKVENIAAGLSLLLLARRRRFRCARTTRWDLPAHPKVMPPAEHKSEWNAYQLFTATTS